MKRLMLSPCRCLRCDFIYTAKAQQSNLIRLISARFETLKFTTCPQERQRHRHFIYLYKKTPSIQLIHTSSVTELSLDIYLLR